MARRHKRRNPMPRKGSAIYLSKNPRRRRPSRKRNAGKGRRSGAFRRVVMKLNRNGKRRRTNGKRRSRRTNGLAVRVNRGHKRRSKSRRNGLAVRVNRNPKRRKTTRRRKNGLAVRVNRRNPSRRRRTNGKRRYAKRRNGLAIRTNGRSRRYGAKRRRNSGAAASGGVPALFKPIIGLVRKVPVVGKWVAPYVAPVALGAIGLFGVHMALQYGGGYLPVQVQPFGYTIGGVVLGLAVQFAPMLSKSTKKALAGAMVVGGAGVDTYRYLTEGGAPVGRLGDGGAWQLGATDDLSDGETAAIRTDYADASLADARFSGEDLDPTEGEAAIAGARVWRRRFPGRQRVTRVVGGCSRHAGQHGHRWGWLVNLVGFQGLRALAAMPAQQRVAYIQQLRHHALSTLPQQLAEQQAEQAALSGAYGSLIYAGQDY